MPATTRVRQQRPAAQPKQKTTGAPPPGGPTSSRLDAAIVSAVRRGEFDALRIVDKLASRNKGEYLREIVSEMAHDLAVDRARTLIHATRLQAERDAKKNATVTASEKARTTHSSPSPVTEVRVADIAQAPVKVPGGGFVRYGEMTADDLRARADMYRRMGGKLIARADWCEGVADRIEAEGVEHLGDLQTVPPLPNGEDADEVLGDVAA